VWPFAWVRTVGFAGRKSDRKGEEEWGSGFGLPIVASSACCKGVRSSIEFASLRLVLASRSAGRAKDRLRTHPPLSHLSVHPQSLPQ